MQFKKLEIADVVLVTPRVLADERGTFSETWKQSVFADAGINARFVQDNHALSLKKGTVRGLHFQKLPNAQGKLVRAARGSILDVAVDLRRASPTYGKHVSAVLTAAGGEQLWVPEGFAHGYITLEDQTEVTYKVTDVYAPTTEGGLLWNDPMLAIDWQLDGAEPILSDKDLKLPRLVDLDAGF
jgi:dTDP-4-dehydrorhamnose 3,5-epimerase